MFYYSYDNISWKLIQKYTEKPTDDTPVLKSEVDFDLTNFDVVVGAVDGDLITWYNPPKPKPTETLIANIQNLQSENNVLGETVAQLNLNSMQLNTTIDILGSSLAQAQLDIITLKGGAA